MFADVLCDIEVSMCCMMTQFVSGDSLHLKQVSGNMCRGVPASRNFFAAQKTKRYFCQKGIFYEEIVLISNF